MCVGLQNWNKKNVDQPTNFTIYRKDELQDMLSSNYKVLEKVVEKPQEFIVVRIFEMDRVLALYAALIREAMDQSTFSMAFSPSKRMFVVHWAAQVNWEPNVKKKSLEAINRVMSLERDQLKTPKDRWGEDLFSGV